MVHCTSVLLRKNFGIVFKQVNVIRVCVCAYVCVCVLRAGCINHQYCKLWWRSRFMGECPSTRQTSDAIITRPSVGGKHTNRWWEGERERKRKARTRRRGR